MKDFAFAASKDGAFRLRHRLYELATTPVGEVPSLELSPPRPINHDGKGQSGYFKSKKMSVELGYESKGEREMLAELDQAPWVQWISTQCLEIPYADGKATYWPDIVFQGINGNYIILEIKTADDMPYESVLRKALAAKHYAVERGYHYIMCNQAGAWDDNLRISLPTKPINQLLGMVDRSPSNKGITYGQALDFMRRTNMTRNELAAICLQHELGKHDYTHGISRLPPGLSWQHLRP